MRCTEEKFHEDKFCSAESKTLNLNISFYVHTKFGVHTVYSKTVDLEDH